jgi:protein LSM14
VASTRFINGAITAIIAITVLTIPQSKTGPSASRAPAPAGNGLASLPPKPVAAAASAHAAMDRVQKSLNDLSGTDNRRRKPQAPAVPDAEFDFSQGNERFQKEREALKTQQHAQPDEDEDQEGETEVGESENVPHPAAIKPAAAAAAAAKPVYSKSSFFDNISSDSSRVSRADERHRNFDTFGEAGGNANRGGYGQQRGGHVGYNNRGGRGQGRGRGRGGWQHTNPQSTGQF